jgi:hypothetical protein
LWWVIIGLLAALAIPTFMGLQRNPPGDRFFDNPRILTQTYATCVVKNGIWPAARGLASHQPACRGRYRDANWLAATPMGGSRNGNDDLYGITAASPVSGAMADETQVTGINPRIHDSNPPIR